MSARDELALDIFLADNSSIPEGELLQDWADAPDHHRPYAHNIADAILAAGYRKPRIVLTGEELDALPEGSVVLDREVCVKRADGYWKVSDLAGVYASADITLPATVIHEPEAVATR